MRYFLFGIMLMSIPLTSIAQKNDDMPRFFGNTLAIDSSTIVLIPTKYDAGLLSSNKLALWDNFYANVIFYDLKSDTHKKLFDRNTFIEPFVKARGYTADHERDDRRLSHASKAWIFYFVKPTDYNSNGKIDNDDPSMLYVSDKAGNQLKLLTAATENAVSIDLFEKQGYALVKMQRDSDNNKKFETKDKDYYYIRIDLNNLTFGNKIEVN